MVFDGIHRMSAANRMHARRGASFCGFEKFIPAFFQYGFLAGIKNRLRLVDEAGVESEGSEEPELTALAW
jgi:hypothetical protein